MDKQRMTYTCSTQPVEIEAFLWLPESEPRAILQLCHGMAEHIERYEPLAEFLCDKGFAVCGNNHLGHGGSIGEGIDLGHMPNSHGAEGLIADVHTLRGIAAERLGSDLPYFMLGHSMGSFVLRAYLARHGEGLSGAIICGTGTIPAIASKAGRTLCHLIGTVKGQSYRSKLIDSMGVGSYNKKIKNPRTSMDWLTHDQQAVDNYMASDLCGFMFSVGAYSALMELTAEVVTPACAARYPKDLPLYYISGEEDPVGDCGEGVRKAHRLALNTGVEEATMRLFPGLRHEILNNKRNTHVRQDVLEWLDSHC